MADNVKMPKYKHLAKYRIPFELTLTDSFVKWLMKISETKPFIDEYLGSPLEVQLLRKAKVRAITYSNQIEGNSLQEDEVTAIIEGKHVAGSPRDIKEIQNYQTALNYVEQLSQETRKFTLRDFCDIQKLITSNILPEEQCGQIRSIDVSIVNSITGEKIEECPPPHALRDLLDDLWQWLDDTKGFNPFARAFAFHFIAVSIHPFVDGNGRTVRLMQHFLLLKDLQKIARFVPSESAILQQQNRYYEVLRQSRKLGSLHPVLEFLAECFAISAEQIAAEGKHLLKNSAQRKPDARKLKILSMAKKLRTFTIQNVLELFPSVPRRTLERDLENLVLNKKIKAKGDNKARTYSV